MFADSLLHAEHVHLFRLLVWAGGSVIAGTLIFVLLAWRRPSASMLGSFAAQTVIWGTLEVGYVAWAWHGISMQDVAGATWLDRLLWLNLGLDVGIIGIGATISSMGWFNERRMGALGTGIGILLQGAALFVINGQLIGSISR